MLKPSIQAFTFAALSCGFLVHPSPAGTIRQEAAEFEAPRRLEAGGSFLGAGRLYPSPVFQDVNGDGRADVIIGDLVGQVTVAIRGETDAGEVLYGKEEVLKGRSGEALKFHNW